VALNALHEQDITFGANLRRARIFLANVERPGAADRVKCGPALRPVKGRLRFLLPLRLHCGKAMMTNYAYNEERS